MLRVENEIRKLQTYCSFLVKYGGNLEKSINANSVQY
jgi:hypothetical protein